MHAPMYDVKTPATFQPRQHALWQQNQRPPARAHAACNASEVRAFMRNLEVRRGDRHRNASGCANAGTRGL